MLFSHFLCSLFAFRYQPAPSPPSKGAGKSETVPTPNDDRITIVEAPALDAYVLPFGGWALGSRWAVRAVGAGPWGSCSWSESFEAGGLEGALLRRAFQSWRAVKVNHRGTSWGVW